MRREGSARVSLECGVSPSLLASRAGAGGSAKMQPASAPSSFRSLEIGLGSKPCQEGSATFLAYGTGPERSFQA
jgi:hypothetical protein